MIRMNKRERCMVVGILHSAPGWNRYRKRMRLVKRLTDAQIGAAVTDLGLTNVIAYVRKHLRMPKAPTPAQVEVLPPAPAASEPAPIPTELMIAMLGDVERRLRALEASKADLQRRVIVQGQIIDLLLIKTELGQRPGHIDPFEDDTAERLIAQFDAQLN